MSSTGAARDEVQRARGHVGRLSPLPAYPEPRELRARDIAGATGAANDGMRGRTTWVRGRGSLIRRALLLADVAGLLTALVMTELLFAGSGVSHDRVSLLVELLLFCVALPGWVIAAKSTGLYDRDEQRAESSTVDDLVGIFHLVTALVWLLAIGSWATGLASPVLPKLATFWLLAVVAIAGARATARAWARRKPQYLQNAVIVGAGTIGQTIAAKLLSHPEFGVEVVGFIDSSPRAPRPGLEHLAVLGGPDELMDIVRLLDVERVIVAYGGETDESVLRLVRPLNSLNVQVDVVPRLFELVAPGHQIHSVGGVPLIGLPPARLSRSSQLLKRCFDIVGAAIGLALLAVPFALIMVFIKSESAGPVFFRQVRMGQAGRAFRIWKFRTMSKDAETQKVELAHLNKHALEGGDTRMFKIRQDPRVTRVGRTLRRFSLDELPQLVNVLRGEMSLVGLAH